jgi:hypothetical protein
MNKKVGVYQIKNEKKESKSTIVVGGSSAFWFIRNYIMRFKSKSVFNHGRLIYSNTIRYLNTDKQDSVRVNFKGGQLYKVFSYKTGDKIIEKILFTGNMMYFSEPKNLSKIFSENKGYFVNVNKINEHTFTSYDNISKEKITYFYKDNILVKAIIEKSFITLTMKLIENDKDKS